MQSVWVWVGCSGKQVPKDAWTSRDRGATWRPGQGARGGQGYGRQIDSSACGNSSYRGAWRADGEASCPTVSVPSPRRAGCSGVCSSALWGAAGRQARIWKGFDHIEGGTIVESKDFVLKEDSGDCFQISSRRAGVGSRALWRPESRGPRPGTGGAAHGSWSTAHVLGRALRLQEGASSGLGVPSGDYHTTATNSATLNHLHLNKKVRYNHRPIYEGLHHCTSPRAQLKAQVPGHSLPLPSSPLNTQTTEGLQMFDRRPETRRLKCTHTPTWEKASYSRNRREL